MTPEQFTAWRTHLGLSKVAAAEALGYTRMTIWQYEAGRKPIPRVVALACCALELGITDYPKNNP